MMAMAAKMVTIITFGNVVWGPLAGKLHGSQFKYIYVYIHPIEDTRLVVCLLIVRDAFGTHMGYKRECN